MVSKCANPECSTSFRYFHEGKLFRIETVAGMDRRRVTLGDESQEKSLLRRLEFYWLCDTCSGKFTLVFDKSNGVTVSPRDRARAAAG